MADFSVEVIEAQPSVTIRLIGSAGCREADKLQFELNRLVARRPAEVILDFAGLIFISSLAMGMLVNLRRALVRHGVQVKLVAVQPNVLEALRASRLDELFILEPSTPQAAPA
jgi:anti-anti-sigma factor